MISNTFATFSLTVRGKKPLKIDSIMDELFDVFDKFPTGGILKDPTGCKTSCCLVWWKVFEDENSLNVTADFLHSLSFALELSWHLEQDVGFKGTEVAFALVTKLPLVQTSVTLIRQWQSKSMVGLQFGNSVILKCH